MLRHPIPLFLSGIICLALSGSLRAQPPMGPSKPYDTALFTAIRSGDLPTLQTQLAAGSDANAIRDGFSALMCATLNGTPQQMQLLIDHGAKVNYTDPDSITALWLAIPDSTKTVLLLAHGADPKQAARDNTLLYLAAGTDDTTLVGYLLRSGFRPNDTTFYGDYPINSALSFRCSATLKMLVDNGADVNIALPKSFFPNLRGMTCLMQAAVADDERSFYYLLDHGADVNKKNTTGYTALMYLQLAEVDHPDMTKALLAHGALPLEKARDGSDALALASKKGNTQSMQLLKQR